MSLKTPPLSSVPLQRGLAIDGKVRIIEGLAAGEAVVTSGMNMLSDGMGPYRVSETGERRMLKTLIHRPLTVLTVFVLLTLLGLFMVNTLPVDLFPDTDLPVIYTPDQL